ncbi:ribbon-helix-helix domain-containing protein [Sphingomonas sp. RT2P30]|uniref:ribbon-helix-helix domain-containing protein n=1 Tax=Parasphingomonas halimpatiens TaxID=3096162 RepID=UPI002FCC2E01
MSDRACWSLKVSRDTDIALRTLLATRGGRKGDLSRFVEEAVNREVMRETIKEVQARNHDLAADVVERMIEEEVGEACKVIWSTPRR